MNWLKNFSAKELFTNKKFAVSFSVLVAFVFWLIIVIDQNPAREVTFNNVPVSISATGTNLETLNMEVISNNVGDSVLVSVNGPSYIVSSLKSDDLLVTADLSSIDRPGEYVLNLFARKISGKSDYDIVSITPSVVTITVDKIVDEYMEVEVVADNISADITADQNLGIEPFVVEDKIHIRGPQSEFLKIERVVALIDETASLTASKTFNSVIKLYDSHNREINPENFSLSATQIPLTAKVYKKKTLPIELAFTNKPEYAPNLSYSITLDSDENIHDIDIQGDPDIVNELKKLETEPIDFSQITSGKNSFRVKLNLVSESLKTSDNIEYVTITFDISGYTQKGVALEVQTVNNPDNLTIDKASFKNVTFMVPNHMVKSFDSSNITASVDLSNKNAGDTVKVVFHSNISGIWVNGDYTVTVKAK